MNTLRIISLLCLAMIVSCTKPIDLELNDEQSQRLVVEGIITDIEHIQEIRLTLTSSYFANEAAPIAYGAVVTVSDGDNTYDFVEEENGYYHSIEEFAGEPGRTFELSIDYGGEQYTASSYMAPTVAIDSLGYELEPYESEEEDEDRFLLNLYCQEPEETLDHYIFLNYKNGVLETDSLPEWEFTNDDGVNGSYIGGFPIGYPIYTHGDTAMLEVLSTSEAHYDFILAMFLETQWRGGPFDTPPANIPSNVSNGALGFFAASAVSRKSIVIE